MAEWNDRRTSDQFMTHIWGVIATDKFLSGWGKARGGTSVAIWACSSWDDAERMESIIARRGDMQRVRIGDLRKYRPGRGVAHVSVYVVAEVDGNRFELSPESPCPLAEFSADVHK